MPHTQKNFTEMTGASLVEAFNAMALSPEGKDLGIKVVSRFSDARTGQKRCEALASSIRAHREGQKAEAARDKKAGAKGAVAKPAREPKAKPDPKKHETQFGKVTRGSNRDKLLLRLLSADGEYLSRNELMMAVYGEANKDKRGPLSMVLKGLGQLIKARDLKYEIKTRKDDKETTVALVKKS